MQKSTRLGAFLDRNMELVVLHPILNLGLSQAQDILSGVGRSLATVYVQEVQTSGGLEQNLFVSGGIAELAYSVLLNQSGSLGVVFLLADNLLHGTNLLSALFTSN